LKPSRRARLIDYLQQKQWPAIGEPEFQQLAADFAPIAEHGLRSLLRDSGLPLSPLVEGVRQSSLDELARTLCALTEKYVPAEAARRRVIRRLVITARDHARLAARRTGALPEKREMILWIETWLENPSAFALWVALRKQASSA
jgi:predicted transcriptional regulator